MRTQVSKAREETAVDPVALVRSRPGFLAWCKNGLTIDMGEATIFADRAPNSREAIILADRAKSLRAALAPSADDRGWAKAVMVMLAGMPAQAGDDAGVQMRGEAFRHALSDLPGWAIERAAGQVIRGHAGIGKTFAPTPAVFREVVDGMLASLRSELELIEDIGRARVVPAPRTGRGIEHRPATPEERERVQAGLLALSESLSGRGGPRVEAEKRAAQDRLDAAKAEPAGVSFSPLMQAALAKREGEAA